MGRAPFQLAKSLQRVKHSTHVLGGGQLDDLHQTEVWIHIDDGPMGRHGERHVSVALAIGIQGKGRRVPVHHVGLHGLRGHLIQRQVNRQVLVTGPATGQ